MEKLKFYIEYSFDSKHTVIARLIVKSKLSHGYSGDYEISNCLLESPKFNFDRYNEDSVKEKAYSWIINRIIEALKTS